MTREAADAVTPLVAAREHSPEPLYAAYTVEQLEVIRDFLARNAERLSDATRWFAE